MKIKLTPNCPFAELSLGNGTVINHDSDWLETEDTKEVQEAIEKGWIEYEGTLAAKKAEQKQITAGKEVWVFAEIHNNKISRVSLELLGKGRELAEKLNAKLATILLTEKDNYSKELISYGADKIYLAEDSLFKHYDTNLYTKVILEAIKKYEPQIVVYGATHIGRDLAPRVARRLDTGLTADCTSLDITEKGELLQTRPAFGGNLMAQILCKKRLQMSTVRPGVMQILPQDMQRTGETIKLNVPISASDVKTKIIESIKSAKKVVNLEEAQIIVAGGRGIGSKENFDKLIGGLAKALHGEVGASRAAIDSGWVEKQHQIGQTGKTVRPKVYIACGISGAIQHLAGMKGAALIIAINKDSTAPILKIADYGFVADLHEFIPALIQELQ